MYDVLISLMDVGDVFVRLLCLPVVVVTGEHQQHEKIS